MSRQPGASTPATTDTDRVAAAERLITAARTRTPCAPVRDLIGTDDVVAAYAVQERIIAGRVAAGAAVVGRKIGLTSAAVQQQLGVDQPDFGVLLDDMRYEQSVPIPLSRLLQPRVEAEIAFVLAHDLVDGALDGGQIGAAVDYAVAALEIVDSRIAGWDITFADTVADNGSSGLFVLGTERRSLDSFTPVSVQMQMAIDDCTVSTGTGAACLGDPLRALTWLAHTARDFGQPLRAGQVILSGALGPMATIDTAGTVRAEITDLGSVTTTFIQE
ncbi:2-keto-4-pentenoate hydratase [Nocardia abscessus]|uniref:2-keto-4-pentenoate hydratase n=1 Tax=Nocardia abscessus TaxID=120957 RepID=UPI000317C341|nr:fumarylacetoacetate hydrolase family protein [Nocardia abscessus]MCC3332204.1 2-keto-4-pentenoate hydratase [Nocardia abscessus]